MKKLALFLFALPLLAQNAAMRVGSAADYCAPSGGTDTYACNLSPAISSYTTGGRYKFKADVANTGAATLNLNAVGAITIKKAPGGVTTDLADNDILVGQMVEVVYDGTNFQMVSLLGNAGGSSGGTMYLFTGVGASVTTGTTTYASFGWGSVNTSELTKMSPMPVAGTAGNLRAYIYQAVGGSGALTFTLRCEGAGTTLVLTIPASSGAGVYAETSLTAAVTLGQRCDVEVANASGGSVGVGGISLTLTY